jgi:hypothetical protein
MSVKNHYLYNSKRFPEMSFWGSQNARAPGDIGFSLISPIRLIGVSDAVEPLSRIGCYPAAAQSEQT